LDIGIGHGRNYRAITGGFFFLRYSRNPMNIIPKPIKTRKLPKIANAKMPSRGEDYSEYKQNSPTNRL